ncbi:MAG TPA: hypothetical protein VHV83_12730 [Armatimonadota bacterium]|nr:hypothetical protein [Armatimonadota bacterium]
MAGVPTSPLDIHGIPWTIYERGLDKITLTTVEKVFNFIPKLYNVQSKKSRQIIERSYAGVTEATDWNPNGEPIPTSTINSRYKILAENGWIGNSVAYTLDMKTFDENDLMTNMAADLANSIATRKQKVAVGFLCSGFGINWNDEAAEPLFCTTHKLDPRYAGGNATASNLVVGAPSVGSLCDAINLLVNTPDDLGNPGTYNPRFVLCHPSKYLEWKMIIGDNRGKSDTNNHTINPFEEYSITPVACPWIVDDKMWFLYSDKHGLVWNDVVGFKSVMDTDAKTQVTTHLAYSCFTRYARDWRGIVASQG